MRGKLQDTKVLAGVVLGGVVLICAAAWILLVSPQHKKATTLDGQIASVTKDIAQRRSDLATPKADIHVRASDVFRLTRAMPDDADMSGLILVLSRIAAKRGLEFQSLTPSPIVPQTGFNVQPLNVVVQGRFGDVSGYLGDLRKLVRVKRHQLAATGRLFSIDSVDFEQPDAKKGYPNVKASLVVDAFTFAGGALGAANPSTSTPSTTNGTVAAGENP